MEFLPASADATLRLGALLADLPTDELKHLTRRWGCANELRDLLVRLAAKKDQWQEAPRWPLAQFKRLVAEENFPALQEFWRAEEARATGQTRQSDRIVSRLDALAPESINPPPLLDGEDLLGMGLAPGPRIGQILKQIRDLQLSQRIENRDQALAEARARIAGDL